MNEPLVQRVQRAMEFLEQIYKDNRKRYGTSFARHLNNEAADEMAEALFGCDVMPWCHKFLSDLRGSV
jgi:hypothetical protein